MKLFSLFRQRQEPDAEAIRAASRSSQLRLLGEMIDGRLRARRAGRTCLSETALRREAGKRRAQLERDPIIRALRPDLIDKGDKHHG